MAKKKSKIPGAPTPPSDLDKIAVEAFNSIVADLHEQGTLQRTDSKLIEEYARAYSLRSKMEAQLAKEEFSLTCENGRSFINPLVNSVNTTGARVRQLLNDLKLSPRTRGKVEAEEIDERWVEPQ